MCIIYVGTFRSWKLLGTWQVKSWHWLSEAANWCGKYMWPLYVVNFCGNIPHLEISGAVRGNKIKHTGPQPKKKIKVYILFEKMAKLNPMEQKYKIPLLLNEQQKRHRVQMLYFANSLLNCFWIKEILEHYRQNSFPYYAKGFLPSSLKNFQPKFSTKTNFLPSTHSRNIWVSHNLLGLVYR